MPAILKIAGVSSLEYVAPILRSTGWIYFLFAREKRKGEDQRRRLNLPVRPQHTRDIPKPPRSRITREAPEIPCLPGHQVWLIGS